MTGTRAPERVPQKNETRIEGIMHDDLSIDPLTHPIEPIPDPDVDFVEQFIHLVPALWRTMKRAAVSGQDLPANESQVTILRFVIHHGRLTPAQLADIMHLARPTISNLLKGLVAEGLVERVVSQRDARVMSVVPTDKGRALLTRFRSDRADTVRAGFDGLDGAEQQALLAAGPALRQLLRNVEQLADEIERDAENAAGRVEGA